ncbi:MAG: tetratricopeptide repeat protein [Actinomycetota bacterium]
MNNKRLLERLGDLSIEAQREIEQGSAERGADLCRQLIQEWSALQGPEGERVLIWRGFLGRALTEARRYREAEDVLAQLLIDRERLLGPDDLSVMVTRGNLARVIALGGRPQEAILLGRLLYADRLRILGPEDPSTLDSLGHIAHFHYLLGDFVTAAELYENLLDERIRILGPNHPHVFQTEHNLASARARSGDPNDIQDLMDTAMELQEQLGFDDLLTLNAFALLVEALTKLGDHSEALRLGILVREGRSRVLGDADARTLSARQLVVTALVHLRRWPEAIDEMMAIVRAGVEQGRDDEVADVSTIATLLSAWLDSGFLRPTAPGRNDSASLLELASLLDRKARQLELSDLYRRIADLVRLTLGHPPLP